jgi:hypothetical protein
MIEKRIARLRLKEKGSAWDLQYWLTRPPAERVAAVDYLRRVYYGASARLQRVARVVQRPQG